MSDASVPPFDEAAFREFQKTRRAAKGAEFDEICGNLGWFEDKPDADILIYADRWMIEKLDTGQYHLVIENFTEITGETVSLEDLERILFEYSLSA